MQASSSGVWSQPNPAATWLPSALAAARSGRGLAQGPLWITAISYWLIGIPTSYVMAFPMGLGGVGLWLGLVVGLAVAAALLMLRFWRGWGRALIAA